MNEPLVHGAKTSVLGSSFSSAPGVSALRIIVQYSVLFFWLADSVAYPSPAIVSALPIIPPMILPSCSYNLIENSFVKVLNRLIDQSNFLLCQAKIKCRLQTAIWAIIAHYALELTVCVCGFDNRLNCFVFVRKFGDSST